MKANLPNEVEARRIVSEILRIAARTEPEPFRAFFGGAIVTNVLGNLPNEYWQKFSDVKPCDNPKCDCHVLQLKIMPILELMREDFKETMGKENAGN